MERINIYDGKGNPVIINVRSYELRLFNHHIGWLTIIDIAPSESSEATTQPFSIRLPNRNFVHFCNLEFEEVILSEDPVQFEGEFTYVSHSKIELANFPTLYYKLPHITG
jgi:hypothetical protein